VFLASGRLDWIDDHEAFAAWKLNDRRWLVLFGWASDSAAFAAVQTAIRLADVRKE